MYHIHVLLLDEETPIEQARLSANRELARISVQVMRVYTNDRIGERSWFMILRGVTAENWGEVSRLTAKALRNVNCRWELRQPTSKRTAIRPKP